MSRGVPIALVMLPTPACCPSSVTAVTLTKAARAIAKYFIGEFPFSPGIFILTAPNGHLYTRGPAEGTNCFLVLHGYGRPTIRNRPAPDCAALNAWGELC